MERVIREMLSIETRSYLAFGYVEGRGEDRL